MELDLTSRTESPKVFSRVRVQPDNNVLLMVVREGKIRGKYVPYVFSLSFVTAVLLKT